MVTRLDHVQMLVDRLRALVPENVEEKEYLSELVYDRMSVGNRSGPMGPMGVVGTPTSEEQAYGAALSVVEHLDQPEQLVLMPEGIVGVANLTWESRPALPLKDGVFKPLEVGPWQHLAPNLVQRQSHSVCRIDLCTNGVLYMQLGTGFVVGADQERLLIMTNAHVANAAVETGWPILPNLTVTCDFARDSVIDGGTLLPVDSDYQAHTNHDLAVLYLRQEHFDGATQSPSLALASNVTNNAINLQIGVLGHPALNTQFDGLFPKHFGFGDAFGIKRFSPGLIRTRAIRPWTKKYPTVDAIFHDATTLGGNSGSCVIDLSSGQVLGLHFGGWPIPAKQAVDIGGQDELARLFYDNGAVPLWTLAQDQMLAQVHFV